MGLETLTEKVSNLHERQGVIEKRQEAMDERMDKTERDNAGLVEKVGGIEKQMVAICSRFDRMFYAIIGFGIVSILKPFFE